MPGPHENGHSPDLVAALLDSMSADATRMMHEALRKKATQFVEQLMSDTLGGSDTSRQQPTGSQIPTPNGRAAQDVPAPDTARGKNDSWITPTTVLGTAAVGAAAYQYGGTAKSLAGRIGEWFGTTAIGQSWNKTVQPAIDRMTGADKSALASNNITVRETRRDISRGKSGFPVVRWHTDVKVKDGGTIRIIHKQPRLDDKLIHAVVDARQKAQADLAHAREQIAPHIEDIFRSPIRDKNIEARKRIGDERPISALANELIQQTDQLSPEARKTFASLSLEAASAKDYMAALDRIGDAAHSHQTIKLADGYLDRNRAAVSEDRKPFAPNNLDSYADANSGKVRVKLTEHALRNDGATIGNAQRGELDRAANAMLQGYSASTGSTTKMLDVRSRARGAIGR